MGSLHKKYVFRGLDTRTNKLYRQEGSASDSRNVYLDSNRRLRKRPDFNALSIPRAADGVTGEFLDELPFDAEIIDFMEYEDHLVIAVQFLEVLAYVNKFYRFYPETGVLEFIPFEKETFNSPVSGQIVNKGTSDISGKFTKTNQENILYFMGGYCADDTGSPFLAPTAATDKKYNLSPLFTYDGKIIGRAGAPSVFNDTVTDEGVQSTDSYMRLLPIKIDNLGRHTFGNYSTHKAINDGFSVGNQELTINANDIVDRSYDHQAFCKPLANATLLAADTALDRTISVDIYNRELNYQSVAKGQYLYSVKTNQILTPFTPPQTTADLNFDIYRCTVEDVDYVAGEVTLTEFLKYNPESALFEDSEDFVIDIDTSAFLSNLIYGVYISTDFSFGFKFAGYTIHAYDGVTDLNFSVVSTLGSSTLTTVAVNPELLYISTDFEDVYDEESVKLPPVKGRQVVEYLSALLIVDQETLYFSDFSVGGTIENFTPFDNFPVGSSKRGSITGVFANETFISVFREEEAYYITGNIFLANYRIQSYQSTRIGCSDPKSIIDFRGAGLFLSKRGIYMCQQGGAMPELSDNIETIFTDNELNLNLDLTKCSALVDFNKEHIYFHIASTSETSGYVLVYSYYHNEWFLWEDVDGTAGFTILNGFIHYSDGSDIYRESTTAIDSTAYHQSNFETLGEPSLIKKFLQILLFTIDMPTSGAIGIQTFRDWKSEVDTEEIKTVEDGQIDMTQRLNPDRSKSMAMRITSEAGNELVLNGYEYEYSADVRMFKNDDS